jgi:carotenoid cleavage dioxygenase
MTTTNRYLEGVYAPVTEEVTVTELDVTGTIPEHLDGRYLRNGPNPRQADPATYHWFTGDGMVHGIRLRGGRAEWYRNRYVRAEDGAGGPNTNVIGHAGKTLAIVEAGGAPPYELTDELETVGPCDFGGTLEQGYTAHPKRDPATGELHAVSYFWGWGNDVAYTVVDTSGRVRKEVRVPFGGSGMVHDFSLTERHAVLYDLPVLFDPDEAMAGTSFPYHWVDDYQARVGVLPREGDAGDVRWFDVEPCYVFHPMNSYDVVGDDGEVTHIVLDVVRHPSMFRRHLLGPGEGTPTLDRWTIDLGAGKVIEERLDDRGQEFPRVDERLVGRRHRFGWSVQLAGADEVDVSGEILKHDLERGTSEGRSFGRGAAAGEFVFVPHSAGSAEDDGVVMGLVYDADRGASDLVLADAATLDDVALVHLPVRVPVGFHGNWVPAGT